jgi:hypothetical protein
MRLLVVALLLSVGCKQGTITRAKAMATISECGTLARMLASYERSTGKQPTSFTDLVGVVSEKPIGPDPYGTEYKFEKVRNKYIVRSAGPDKKFGTEDDFEFYKSMK